uniref:Uncharacterized protein n=1 Tax=Setaria italica TaxID=4555 RepID=K3YLJ7_SETIT
MKWIANIRGVLTVEVLSKYLRWDLLSEVVLQPELEDSFFEDWWARVSDIADGQVQKGLDSIIILVAWSVWNQHNRCVFDGLQPDVNSVLSSIRDDMHLWCIAGLEEFHISSP